MINSSIPGHWRDLQANVAQILSECNLRVETEKTISLARGNIVIDVFAEDSSQTPSTIYLCECKYWNSSVPKKEVHAFRTVVNDSGANWGLIISKKGFQRGAYEASSYTNLKLLNWQEFQALFAKRWFREYMIKKLSEETEPLVDYTEPINARVFRKADALSLKAQERFRILRRKYALLAYFSLRFYIPFSSYENELPKLPLLENISELLIRGSEEISGLPEKILKSASLRDLLSSMVKHLQIGIAEFDDIFGERA